MADIAQIGFRADTADLDTAKAKLEALPGAAQKAERASDKLEKTLEALSKVTADMVKAADSLTKATDKLANSHKSGAANSNEAKSATDKLNTSYDKSAEAAGKAAAASKTLQDQVSKTAAASQAASEATLRSLKDEAAARLAAGKDYDAGLKPRTGGRTALGGIIPNFEQDSNAVMAGLDKLIGKQNQATAANDNFEKSVETTNKTMGKTPSLLGSIVSVLGKLGSAFIAAFALNKIVDFFSKTTEGLIKLGDTAKQTGIDLVRLQTLQAAGLANGISNDQFLTGVYNLAEKLNEAKHTENELSQLFDDNNVKLKTRTGEMISTNDALMRTSSLIQNAASEFDKIKIAEAVGLTRDWIPLLEQGPDAIEKIAKEVGGLGTIFDQQAIDKARQFNREWSEAVDRWVKMFKSAAIAILGFIDWIIGKASGLFGMLDRYSKQVQANEDIKNNGVAGASRDTVSYLVSEAERTNSQLDKSVKDRKVILDEMDAENQRYGKIDEIAGTAIGTRPLTVNVRKPGGKTTDVSSLFPDSSSGGGGGKTDAEKYDDIITRAEARIAKLQAERDAIGLTAEAAAKLKYETDLLNQAKKADIDLTDEQKNKLMGLAAQMAQTEVETKQLKDALDFGKDITKGFLTDFLQGVKNGESVFKSFGNAALNVLNKISDKLISMAVDSLFTKGSGGGLGGLLGGIGKLLFGGGSALGDAFTAGGKVSRFANGGAFTNGVYSRPTLFQYANGGAFGVMGEAGPEAVMPLKRGPDGSLGVQMHADNGNGSQPVSISAPVYNTYRIEGAVTSGEVMKMVKDASQQSVDQVRRQIIPWINQYNQDGALL